MIKLFGLVFFLSVLGCKAKKDFTEDFIQWPYDTSVLANIPKYDSIRYAVITNIDSFDFSETGNRFTYVYNFDSLSNISGYSNDSLPKSILPVITATFRELGKNKISGFSISKDSTLDIWVRATHLKEYFLDVRERLYWKPRNSYFDHLPFPFKDTMVSKGWQYVVWFDKRSEIL